MIRRLIQQFAQEVRRLRLANALSKADAALYAHDSRLLEGAKHRRAPLQECPIQDCSFCERPAPSPVAVATEEQQRAQEVNRASWWLITAYPDVWYFAKAETVEAVAIRLVRLRTAVMAGRIDR